MASEGCARCALAAARLRKERPAPIKRDVDDHQAHLGIASANGDPDGARQAIDSGDLCRPPPSPEIGTKYPPRAVGESDASWEARKPVVILQRIFLN